MNQELKNQEIARYFCENQIKAHVKRKDGIFFNGFIKEVGSDFFIFIDQEDGHIVIFFRELERLIEECREEKP